MTDTAPIEQARTYLAVFLRPERAELAWRQVVDEVGADADRTVVLGAAHRRLTDEVRVAEEVAADVLVRDLGLTTQEAAEILGLSGDRVEAAVDEAIAIEQELAGQAPSHGDVAPTDLGRAGPSRPRRTLTILVGALATAAIVLAVGLSTTGGTSGQVRVTDIRTAVDVAGSDPGPAQDVFGPDEPVVLWFSYVPLEEEVVVELVLLRDGAELIAPSFPLRTGGTGSHMTLPPVVTDAPGDYRIELRRDGRVLAEADFQVRSE